MKRRQGFTVTELMIAIVIIGVLATLAIPSFTSYIYKSRVAEATTFLGQIKQRQESYRNEFGRYATVSNPGGGNSWANHKPSGNPGIDPVPWEVTTEWQQLGAAPDGPVRFRYATLAGVPGSSVPNNSNLDNGDHWFAAQALGDLNEDGTTFVLEIYSQSSHIYNSAAGKGGWE